MSDSSWVVIELSPEGEELATQGKLESKLRKDLGSPTLQVVISKKSSYPLNYVFVESSLFPSRYFSLEKRSYVERVLSKTVGSVRLLEFVPGRELLRFNKSLKTAQPNQYTRGQPVEISAGIFSRVRGRFVALSSPEEGLVEVQTRTLIRILTIPLVDLSPSEDQTLPPLYTPPFVKAKSGKKNKVQSRSVGSFGTMGGQLQISYGG